MPTSQHSCHVQAIVGLCRCSQPTISLRWLRSMAPPSTTCGSCSPLWRACRSRSTATAGTQEGRPPPVGHRSRAADDREELVTIPHGRSTEDRDCRNSNSIWAVGSMLVMILL